VKISLIVAAAENGVIGSSGDLPWKLSADLRRFKRLTMGHWIVMGRKTYESIGRLLPGRTTVIVTRQSGYRVAGAVVTHSLEHWCSGTLPSVLAPSAPTDRSAPTSATAPSPAQAFIIGGAEIYAIALPLVSEIHLTRVHETISGDTFLPPIDWSDWGLVASERHAADEKNDHDYSFETYRRMGVGGS
jgi:dihydrofolate reductase